MLKIKIFQIPQKFYKKSFIKKDFYIKGVSTDTRTMKKGEVFIALKGEKFDGHNFIKEALSKGAEAIVCEQDFYKRHQQICRSHNFLVCESTQKFLIDFANFLRKKQQEMKVMGITGSCGKTTTKEIIGNILSKKFNTIFSKDSYNNFIGVSLTIFRIESSTQFLVLEMGTNKKGEILKLSKIVEPHFSLITNIGPSHLESFRNIRNVYLEKIKILKFTKEKVFLNTDDRYLRKTSYKNKITFALKEKADFTASIKEKQDFWIRFYVPQLREEFKINSPFLHNVYNSLAGITVLINLGLEVSFIRKKLKDFVFPKMRTQIIKKRGLIIINDAYNSNPLSLDSALRDLGSFKDCKRKILILADMLELGRKTKFYHSLIGKRLLKYDFDYLFCFGLNARFVFEVVKDNKKNCEYFETKGQLLKRLKKITKKGDLLFLKGSRKMKLEEILEAL